MLVFSFLEQEPELELELEIELDEPQPTRKFKLRRADKKMDVSFLIFISEP